MMNDDRLIQSLRQLQPYLSIMEKLTLTPQALTYDEKTYILTCAIILIRKYEKDKRFTSYIELAYYIILKYSLALGDFEPLYDFSTNIGFYPISHAIFQSDNIEFNTIASSLISTQIISKFKHNKMIETLQQNITYNNIISSAANELSYIAPTSFGKSSVIIEHIIANQSNADRFAIIVPTKSLLMQTYRSIRDKNIGLKILIHDEMYDNENRFIAVFTQERALRLLEKNEIFFDILYIDEAHRLLEKDMRSVLLARLIKLNLMRNKSTKIVYLSPLIADTNSLKVLPKQNIFEQRISFNLKEPEYYEYRTNGETYKYNRFIDTFFKTGYCSDMFEYIHRNKTAKSFCYLYSPKKIEQFAKALAKTCEFLADTSCVDEIILNLKKYVHSDFYIIDYLKKGIIYLHGKMPDTIKEYLEYKFTQITQIQFLIANKVILEGINLPIDSLFVLSGRNLNITQLVNLIGRVNRLDQIFGDTINLHKLMPPVHFVNSDEFNRVNGKLENKIRLLKSTKFSDNIKNPILEKFDFNEINSNETMKESCKTIVDEENFFFSIQNDPIQKLKQKMISLGMNIIYKISDDLCEQILNKIGHLERSLKLNNPHFLDKLRYVFIRHFDDYIIDKEFYRLKNDKAIAYYKMYFDNRKKSLKENIAAEILYFQRRISEDNTLLYIGESYGERPYSYVSKGNHQNVYVDLRSKTKQEMANLAIVKLKIEEDFISYKLHMFFQLMYEYELLTLEEYQQIIYGTTDPKKLHLVKMGLTINIINRLDDDKQLENISIDSNNNLSANDKFRHYKDNVDDFYRFELNKFL